MQDVTHIHARLLRLLGGAAVLAASLAVLFAGAAQAKKPSVSQKAWGTVPANLQPAPASSKPVTLYSLKSGNGMTVKITNYGGVVQSILVPDRNGNSVNVALGFQTLKDYVSDFTQGATGNAVAAVRRVGRHVLRRDHRPVREPDRQRVVHAQRQALHARRQQRPEHAPRRVPRLEHPGLERLDVCQ